MRLRTESCLQVYLSTLIEGNKATIQYVRSCGSGGFAKGTAGVTLNSHPPEVHWGGECLSQL